MQTNIMKYTFTIGALFLLAACGNTSKDSNKLLTDKKAELQKLKDQEKGLEDEIAKLDTSKVEKPKLVVLATIAPQTFTHYIDLQGKVESDKISTVTPRGNGGQVKALYIKRGDIVRKGQLLLKLDDAVARQNLVAAQTNLETGKTQIAFLQNLYDKQKNLWDQKIGTEVQLITAKNNVETAQNQLKTSEEQVKLYKDQLDFTNVYSDVDGVADIVNVRVGEIFSASSLTSQVVIVNTSDLKITAIVPENYLGRVKPGSNIKIAVPDINKNFDAKVTAAGTSIDAINHGFFVESKLHDTKGFYPNQVALVKIQDYTVNNAITVPVNTLQNDEKGKYVMVAVKENNKLLARKRAVTSGEFYGDNLEIKSGLQPGDQVITDGFQSLYDGQLLTTETK